MHNSISELCNTVIAYEQFNIFRYFLLDTRPMPGLKKKGKILILNTYIINNEYLTTDFHIPMSTIYIHPTSLTSIQTISQNTTFAPSLTILCYVYLPLEEFYNMNDSTDRYLFKCLKPSCRYTPYNVNMYTRLSKTVRPVHHFI